jgi:hypothetical protein
MPTMKRGRLIGSVVVSASAVVVAVVLISRHQVNSPTSGKIRIQPNRMETKRPSLERRQQSHQQQ